MPNFEQALKIVLEHEGGFSNNPADAGGATKYGVTIDTWESWVKKNCTAADIEALTIEDVSPLYKTVYWDRLKLDEFQEEELAVFVFDQAVNGGVENVVLRLQRLLGVHPDGVMGPMTVKAANLSDASLGGKFMMASMHYYIDIVKNKPDQIKFLGGWTDRIFSLLDLGGYL